MSVDEGCSSVSVLGQFVGVYLMMCNMILILTGHNKVLECIWDSVMWDLAPNYSAAQKKVLGSIKSYFIAIDITF